MAVLSGFMGTEIEYPKDQGPGRSATVNVSGRPHAVPDAFWNNTESGAIDVGGYNMGRSKKFRDTYAPNTWSVGE